jgi:hypothetical protein
MDINIIIECLMGVFAIWAGSVEYRLRTMKKETLDLIDLKTESTKVVQQRIAKDVERLELKIDKLIDLLLKIKPNK